MLVCDVCGDSNFYDDDGGVPTCASCGTLSQRVVSQETDAHDFAGLAVNMRMHRVKGRKSVIRYDESTMTDFLSLYQQGLRLLAERMPTCTDAFLEWIRFLWFEYLKEWMASYRYAEKQQQQQQQQILAMSSQNEYSHEQQSPSPQSHSHSQPLPMIPSKVLMLAFINLACRHLRLAVLPSDLIRWCTCGVLPFTTLFELLPHDRNRLSSKYKKILKWQFQETIVSSTNILQQTNWLTKFLRIPLPPLNTPLIAATMIQNMGWPMEQVWTRFVRLSKLLQSSEAVPAFQLSADQTGEQIMAKLVVCVKLCRGYERWPLIEIQDTLLQHSSSAKTTTTTGQSKVFPYYSVSDFSQVSRGELPQLLRQIREVVPAYEHVYKSVANYSLISQPVQRFFHKTAPNILATTTTTNANANTMMMNTDNNNNNNNNNPWSAFVQSNNSVFLHSNNNNNNKRKASRDGNADNNNNNDSSNNNPNQPRHWTLRHYPINDNDSNIINNISSNNNNNNGYSSTRLYPDSYVRLLQLCAVHSQCSSHVLEAMVRRVEENVIEFLFVESNNNNDNSNDSNNNDNNINENNYFPKRTRRLPQQQQQQQQQQLLTLDIARAKMSRLLGANSLLRKVAFDNNNNNNMNNNDDFYNNNDGNEAMPFSRLNNNNHHSNNNNSDIFDFDDQDLMV